MRGRPKKVWTEQDCASFKTLCSQFNTEEDICAVLNVNTDTLIRLINQYLFEDIRGHKKRRGEEKVNFSEAFKKYSAGGRMSLRREQFRLANNGDRTMLIWLGKQHLGQAERVETKQEVRGQHVLDVDGLSEEELDARLAEKAAKVLDAGQE